MENERDPFGEKFEERAKEDFYFAAKDRELIEEMKTHWRKDQAAVQQRRLMTCPKCQGTLERYKFMDFVLDRCEGCEGIWLEKGSIEAILRQAARGPLAAFLDRCFSKKEPETKS